MAKKKQPTNLMLAEPKKKKKLLVETLSLKESYF